MTTVDAITASTMARYIERAETLNAEAASIRDDLKTVFAEAKSAGFDPREIKRIIKFRKADAKKARESKMIFDTYVAVLASLADTELGKWALEYVKDEIIEPPVVMTAEERAKAAVERTRIAREELEAAVERRDAERIAKIPDPKKSAADRAMETSMREASKRGGSTLGTAV